MLHSNSTFPLHGYISKLSQLPFPPCLHFSQDREMEMEIAYGIGYNTYSVYYVIEDTFNLTEVALVYAVGSSFVICCSIHDALQLWGRFHFLSVHTSLTKRDMCGEADYPKSHWQWNYYAI